MLECVFLCLFAYDVTCPYVSLLCVCFLGSPELVVCASYYPLQPHTNSYGFGQMVRIFSPPPLWNGHAHTHLLI